MFINGSSEINEPADCELDDDSSVFQVKMFRCDRETNTTVTKPREKKPNGDFVYQDHEWGPLGEREHTLMTVQYVLSLIIDKIANDSRVLRCADWPGRIVYANELVNCTCNPPCAIWHICDNQNGRYDHYDDGYSSSNDGESDPGAGGSLASSREDVIHESDRGAGVSLTSSRENFNQTVTLYCVFY